MKRFDNIIFVDDLKSYPKDLNKAGHLWRPKDGEVSKRASEVGKRFSKVFNQK